MIQFTETKFRIIRYSVIAIGILFGLSNHASADQIVLTGGITAETDILDTSGCLVKIRRNESVVEIEKKQVDYIVWKDDTISYKGYVCAEKPKPPKPVVNFKDTPEYKLMAIFDNAPVVDDRFVANTEVAVLDRPLEGNCKAEEFVGVVSPAFDVLQKKARVNVMSPALLLKELEAEKPNVDYVFVSRTYQVTIRILSKRSVLSGYSSIPAGYGASRPAAQFGPRRPQKKLLTEGGFLIYSAKRKGIVFKRSVSKDRSIWNDEVDLAMKLLAPGKWEDLWENRKTDLALDKNANTIRNKIVKELKKYLEIL